jgi:hypothetical protein
LAGVPLSFLEIENDYDSDSNNPLVAPYSFLQPLDAKTIGALPSEVAHLSFDLFLHQLS